MKPFCAWVTVMAMAGLFASGGRAADKAAKAPGKSDSVYTDIAKVPPDFNIQGEYEGEMAGKKIGVQVIGLGEDCFQAVFHAGGLPGAGWDGSQKFCIDAKIDGGKAVFMASKEKKKYLGAKPSEFSAIDNPPAEQKNYSGTIENGAMKGKSDTGEDFSAKRIVRESPTLSAKAPEGAVVLFDGSNKDAWTGGRLDEATKLLNTDGKDILTKQKFLNYTMHIEFMLPYRPAARGQGRGNSGFYQIDHYEVQILDSFGLMGKNNECGGVYTKANPKVNMCLPPLQWQTYDVEFAAAQVGQDGKKTKNAVMTVKHNGVLIHESLEINGVTGGSRKDPEGTSGPIKLQGHGNPLQFRNIWIVEKK